MDMISLLLGLAIPHILKDPWTAIAFVLVLSVGLVFIVGTYLRLLFLGVSHRVSELGPRLLSTYNETNNTLVVDVAQLTFLLIHAYLWLEYYGLLRW